jgi:hypothetical protein
MAEGNADFTTMADDAPSESRRRIPATPTSSFRFTIGGMLVITFAAAVVMASLFAFPPVISAVVALLMGVCIPAMLVGCLIYGSAGWRAFAVGMLLPSVLRVLSGLFGGMYSGSSTTRILMLQQQMMQQLTMRQMRGGISAAGPRGDSSAFEHFGQLIEMWDKVGYAYMTEETLFWGASTIAGIATLLVQQRFARASAKRTA